MEETDKSAKTEPIKTVDIENKSAKDIFSQVYGKDVIQQAEEKNNDLFKNCLLYTSPSPRDQRGSRMPSSA